MLKRLSRPVPKMGPVLAETGYTTARKRPRILRSSGSDRNRRSACMPFEPPSGAARPGFEHSQQDDRDQREHRHLVQPTIEHVTMLIAVGGKCAAQMT